MSRLQLILLGTFQVANDGAPSREIESDKGRGLLAYLATESGYAHRREALAALLWPDAEPAKSSQNLRRAIYNLRQVLEGEAEAGTVLLVSRQVVQFNSASGHEVDVSRLVALLDAAATHPHSSIDSCPPCIQALQEAAELYAGDFLAGLSLSSEPFEAWRAQKQEHLHMRMMEALALLASYHQRRQEYSGAIRYLRRQVTLEPWREEVHHQLIGVLALAGQSQAALQQYEVCCGILADQLGAVPSPELIDLQERILHGEFVAATPRGRKLGPHNLPVQPTALIGRERELTDLATLLGRADVRLVTLKGPGGTGKTRLALEAGTLLLESFPDGVWLVELASLVEPSLVLSSLAATLGVKSPRDPQLIDTLKMYLAGKQLLLLVDNFEHLLDAAGDVSRLLSAAPGVKVLATSRIPLHIRGEREYSVPPLALPDTTRPSSPETLSRHAAVRLFVERATAARADFQLTGDNAAAVAEICVRLDGLPLALELAAARVRLFSAQALLARLSKRLKVLTDGARDLPPRQQSLRASIEWSYDLLAGAEQQLFARLAVFQSHCSPEAVEAVCNYDGRLQVEVLDGVQSLLDKSLLRRREGYDGEPRFWMLETIREYARERLEASGEAEQLEQQHAIYFMSLAEQAEPQLMGNKQVEWLRKLADEHDNIRAALHWARTTGHAAAVEVGLRLAGAIWRFWNVRGYDGEGRAQLEDLLARESALAQHEPGAYRAKALHGVGVLAWALGDYASSRTFYQQSLALRRAMGDKLGMSVSLNNLGNVALSEGDFTTARDLHEQSLALKRELGDKWGIAYSLNNLGTVAKEQTEYTTARSLYEESLALRRELGDELGIAYTLNNLGNVACLQGDYSTARLLHEQSLALKQRLGEKYGIALTLNDLAVMHWWQGDHSTARALHEQSLALRRELGDRLGIAVSLAGLGETAVSSGRPQHGVMVLAAAERLFWQLGAVLSREDRVAYDSALAAARAQLGQEEFARAWQVGRLMGMEEAIALALQDTRALTAAQLDTIGS